MQRRISKALLFASFCTIFSTIWTAANVVKALKLAKHLYKPGQASSGAQQATTQQSPTSSAQSVVQASIPTSILNTVALEAGQSLSYLTYNPIFTNPANPAEPFYVTLSFGAQSHPNHLARINKVLEAGFNVALNITLDNSSTSYVATIQAYNMQTKAAIFKNPITIQPANMPTFIVTSLNPFASQPWMSNGVLSSLSSTGNGEIGYQRTAGSNNVAADANPVFNNSQGSFNNMWIMIQAPALTYDTFIELYPNLNQVDEVGKLKPDGTLHFWNFGFNGQSDGFAFMRDPWANVTSAFAAGKGGVAASISETLEEAIVKAFNAGAVSMSMIAFDAQGNYIADPTKTAPVTAHLYMFDNSGALLPETPLVFSAQNYSGAKGSVWPTNMLQMGGFGATNIVNLPYPFVIDITNNSSASNNFVMGNNSFEELWFSPVYPGPQNFAEISLIQGGNLQGTQGGNKYALAADIQNAVEEGQVVTLDVTTTFKNSTPIIRVTASSQGQQLATWMYKDTAHSATSLAGFNMTLKTNNYDNTILPMNVTQLNADTWKFTLVLNPSPTAPTNVTTSATSNPEFNSSDLNNMHIDFTVNNQQYLCMNNYSKNISDTTYPAKNVIILKNLKRILEGLPYTEWQTGVYLTLVSGTNVVWICAQDSSGNVITWDLLPGLTSIPSSAAIKWAGSWVANPVTGAVNTPVLYQTALASPAAPTNTASATVINPFHVGGSSLNQLHVDVVINKQSYVLANLISKLNPTGAQQVNYPPTGSITLRVLPAILNALSYAQWQAGVYLTLVAPAAGISEQDVWICAQDNTGKVLGWDIIPSVTASVVNGATIQNATITWSGSFVTSPATGKINTPALYKISAPATPAQQPTGGGSYPGEFGGVFGEM